MIMRFLCLMILFSYVFLMVSCSKKDTENLNTTKSDAELLVEKPWYLNKVTKEHYYETDSSFIEELDRGVFSLQKLNLKEDGAFIKYDSNGVELEAAYNHKWEISQDSFLVFRTYDKDEQFMSQFSYEMDFLNQDSLIINSVWVGIETGISVKTEYIYLH